MHGAHAHGAGGDGAGLVQQNGVDAASGCQTFEATDFLLRKRAVDTSSALVLWQIGAIGVRTYKRTYDNWSLRGLKILNEVLEERYGRDHEVIVYEARKFPFCDPVMRRVRLSRLSKTAVTTASTLYVPPSASRNGTR